MTQEKKTRRLFFGLEVAAPWPENYPQGRLVDVASRHVTVAFLGNMAQERCEKLTEDLPSFPLKVGPVGVIDQPLFLPEKRPRVVAWHVDWLELDPIVRTYQKDILHHCHKLGFPLEEREFLSHVTIARAPFDAWRWKKAFQKLPVMARGIHLYESVGQLTYKPNWSAPLYAPFEELDHTADLGFLIHAATVAQLEQHARTALGFVFPPLLAYFSDIEPRDSLDDVVIALNNLIACADAAIGCPFKAVSFHGKIEETEPGLLRWEMIVDV